MCIYIHIYLYIYITESLLYSRNWHNTVNQLYLNFFFNFKRKGIQIGKEEVKLSLFADNMILYIENPKDATRKLLQLISEHGKVTEYKIKYINLLHFYTLKMKLQKEKLRKTIPFTIASKRIKYLGISLPKETKDLYSENCKT